MLHSSELLDRYFRLRPALAQEIGSRGGFSGARLWRLQTVSGEFCLKAWPPEMTAERLRWIHRLLDVAHAQRVDFVPVVVATAGGDTLVEDAVCVWDLSTWRPGIADFHAAPSRACLTAAAAAAALARLHRAWEPKHSRRGPCPGVKRRLTTLHDWRELVATGWRPQPPPDDPVRPSAEPAWNLLPAAVAAAERALRPWRDVALPLHPCWCDPWHDHLLFTGDQLTGLIDYGSVKEDHAAIDLARMLGSLVGDDPAPWDIALSAYRAVRPLTEQESLLAAVLDQAGVVAAVATWLRWLYHEQRSFENRETIAWRLRDLVKRLEAQAVRSKEIIHAS